jgi:hypothetical protein
MVSYLTARPSNHLIAAVWQKARVGWIRREAIHPPTPHETVAPYYGPIPALYFGPCFGAILAFWFRLVIMPPTLNNSQNIIFYLIDQSMNLINST